jgi:hypothetical protein
MEKISWTDGVRNEGSKKTGIYDIQQKEGKVIELVTSCSRNYLLKHDSEGKITGRIEMTGTQGRRRKQILDDLKQSRESTAN